MFFKPEHFQNAQSSISATLSGRIISVKAEQPENAYLPIFLTPSEIVTDTSEEPSLNVLDSILVTSSGIIIDIRPLIH